MAKFKFIEKLKNVDFKSLPKIILNGLKEATKDFKEITDAGLDGAFIVGGSIVEAVDDILALFGWMSTKAVVYFARQGHDFHIKVEKNRKEIIKNAMILGSGALLLVVVFSWATAYEYSYHGRPLGVVEEQRDVIEILELASEELSKAFYAISEKLYKAAQEAQGAQGGVNPDGSVNVDFEDTDNK